MEHLQQKQSFDVTPCVIFHNSEDGDDVCSMVDHTWDIQLEYFGHSIISGKWSFPNSYFHFPVSQVNVQQLVGQICPMGFKIQVTLPYDHFTLYIDTGIVGNLPVSAVGSSMSMEPRRKNKTVVYNMKLLYH